MGNKATEAIAEIKTEVRIGVWGEQIQACKRSGMTVKEWCKQNNVNIKTYYYHLRKVREGICKSVDIHNQSIVPICKSHTSENNVIEITSGEISIKLPEDISVDCITTILRELK